MLDEYDDARTQQRDEQGTEPTPVQQAERPGGSARRELYAALMSGFGSDEQHELEELMHDNEERLRETGDGYAP